MRQCLWCQQELHPSFKATAMFCSPTCGNYYRNRDKIRWLMEQKSLPCVDCGNTYPYYLMQFDHIAERGPKKFQLAIGIVPSHSLSELREERAKCDLVCSMCHDTRTWDRKADNCLRLGLQHMGLLT